MKKLMSLFFAAAVLLQLHSAENLLRNAGFENARSIPWQSWPGPSKISTENPASGKQCMAVPALAGRSEYLLQKNIPVKPGYVCSCSLKARSDDCKKALKVSLIFRDASGAVANPATVITRTATKEWVKSRGAAIAPATAATVDVSIVVPSGSGTYHIDDVSLEQGSRILGAHGASRVEPTKDGFRIVTRLYTLDFIEKRNFGLASASFNGKKLIRHFFLYVPFGDKTKTSFFLGTSIVTGLKVTERDGSFIFTVEENFPHLKVERSVECWDNEPYVKFTCKLNALSDFISPRVCMDFGFTGSLIGQSRGSRVKYSKWTKPGRWFNLDRPDDPRVISFLDNDGQNGIALIGLDKTGWAELPGKLLCNSLGKDGDTGFGIGLVKWVKRDVRKGDKVSYEVLAAAVGSHAEAVRLADQLSPGN